jgi:hypothetical protein
MPEGKLFLMMRGISRRARTRRHAAWHEGHVRTRPLRFEGYGFAPEMIVVPCDHAAHLNSRSEPPMTAYLISLALAGLIAIAVWEGFS